MERLVAIDSVDIADKIVMTLTVHDGLSSGQQTVYQTHWDPLTVDTVQLVTTLTGMTPDSLRQWRQQQGLSAIAAIKQRSLHYWYRVEATGHNPPMVNHWIERFGTTDPLLADIKEAMATLTLTRNHMRIVCEEEFGVARYEQLSLVDREQLIALLTEPGASQWADELIRSSALAYPEQDAAG